MKKLKGYVVAFVSGAVMFNAIPVVAQSVDVLFDSINITVNSKKVEANNILYNGSTYVPLRAIAEMLDKEVVWDSATNTASINDKGLITSTPAPTAPQQPTIQQPAAQPTIGQANALKSANQYLEYTAFSYQGLIEQLEYEKFSNEDAVYAANHCGADWNEQAAKSAKAYLEYSSFSRDSLISQLEHEGYTSVSNNL